MNRISNCHVGLPGSPNVELGQGRFSRTEAPVVGSVAVLISPDDHTLSRSGEVHGSAGCKRLSWTEALVLGALCLVLFGSRLAFQHNLTTHEAVHCENVHEMFTGGDWLIPTYGGRPWLERPPLPHWFTGIVASVTGGLDSEWAMRLGSVLAGTTAVLLLASTTAIWYGRGIGLLSGAVLATMREFSAYASGAEADIFLCTLVMLAHALLVRQEFVLNPKQQSPRLRFLGWRSWTMLGFFAVLGLMNLAKGPLFGLIFVAPPLAVYFLWNCDFQAVRRYVWLWGWVAYVVPAGAWYDAALARCPDMVNLWTLTFSSRMDNSFFDEAPWYYLITQPGNCLPWTLPALFGLLLAASRAFRQRALSDRYLLCWALVPVALLSIPHGKHHHYLLPTLPAMAVFGALGAASLWRWFVRQPSWLRKPWLATIIAGSIGDLVLARYGSRIPGPGWLLPALMVAWPVGVFAFWYAASSPRGRSAAMGVFAIMAVGLCLFQFAQAAFANRYEEDSRFVFAAAEQTPAGLPVLVINDSHPLDAAWFLYYLHGRGRLLHNVTFLRSDDLPGTEVYLIARS